MDKQRLNQELAHLHAELQQIESADSTDREMLSKLAADIQNILDQQESEPHHYQNLTKRLKEAITQFEASHPRVTLLMRQVIDQLAYLGI